MKLVDLTLVGYVDEVRGESPAPGGGSVSAYAGALGVSLTQMVGSLTIDKKAFLEVPDDKKEEMKKLQSELCAIRKELLEIVDTDASSFDDVMKAFKLPKETDEEKKVRSEEIQKALKTAIQTPYEIVVLSGKAMELLAHILEYGNQNAATDIGVGAMLLMTGLEGGILNVKVNLSSITDTEYVERINKEIAEIKEKASVQKDEILKKVNSVI